MRVRFLRGCLRARQLQPQRRLQRGRRRLLLQLHRHLHAAVTRWRALWRGEPSCDKDWPSPSADLRSQHNLPAKSKGDAQLVCLFATSTVCVAKGALLRRATNANTAAASASATIWELPAAANHPRR